MRTDVLIVGAGPAGTSLAYRLARLGLRTMILDRAAFPRDKTCGGGLTPRALRALARLDLAPETLLAHGRPYAGYRLFSPEGRDTVVRYRPSNSSQSPLDMAAGVVIKREWLDMALLERCESVGTVVLQKAAAVQLLRCGSRVTGAVIRQNDHYQEISSAVTVIATGAQTGLLREAGLEHPAARRPAPATRMYLDGVEGLDDLLDVVYTPALAPGYLWIFPLSHTMVNVGLGLGFGSALGEGALPRALEDIRRCNPIIEAVLSRARPIGKPANWVLRATFPHANTYDAGLLVIGEAAGLVDPLTGEGITFALESAELAAQVLARTLNEGHRDREHLSEYDRILRQRYADYFEAAFRVRAYAAHPELLDLLFRLGSPLAKLSGRLSARPRLARDQRRVHFWSGVPARTWLQVPPAVYLLWRMARLRRERSQSWPRSPTALGLA